MTRDEAKQLLPIIEAFSEGKTIEHLGYNEKWKVLLEPMFNDDDATRYRIKPTPKYRPFANAEECMQEMLKHQPVGWLKQKVSKVIYCIGSCDIENIYVGTTTKIHAYNKALDEFTFYDGSVFGVKEESEG